MKLVCNVGINDADYVVRSAITVGWRDGKQLQETIHICPYYRTWANMLKRCYSESSLRSEPTYKGVTVCEEWKRFSSFKAWMEKQNWQRKELDKDLLVRGNKIYGPETCVFISRRLNTFIKESKSRNNGLAQGVSYDKKRKKFKAQINDPFSVKNVFLGRYDSELGAYKAWGSSKLKFAIMLADMESCEKIKRALIMKYIEFKEDFKYDPVGCFGDFLECLEEKVE